MQAGIPARIQSGWNKFRQLSAFLIVKIKRDGVQ